MPIIRPVGCRLQIHPRRNANKIKQKEENRNKKARMMSGMMNETVLRRMKELEEQLARERQERERIEKEKNEMRQEMERIEKERDSLILESKGMCLSLNY